MKNQSAEYLNGLLKIGKWNYQVSINADYKISYSYLDRIIKKVVDVQGIKKVFGVSSTNNSKSLDRSSLNWFEKSTLRGHWKGLYLVV